MATATNRYITAKEVVTRVMKAVALTAPATVAGSTQSIPQQLFALLSEFGQELMTDYDWQIRTKTQELTVIGPTKLYPVPDDLVGYMNNTGWNYTSRLPLIGPLTEQQWQEIKARAFGGTTFAMMFRVVEDQIEFYYVPDSAQTCKISYESRGWVRDGADPTLYKDKVEADGDVVLFDPVMVVAGLELMWKKKKGFPTADEEVRYRKLLGNAKFNDRPRGVLSTSGTQQYPYLGYVNIPDTNYGG